MLFYNISFPVTRDYHGTPTLRFDENDAEFKSSSESSSGVSSHKLEVDLFGNHFYVLIPKLGKHDLSPFQSTSKFSVDVPVGHFTRNACRLGCHLIRTAPETCTMLPKLA